MTQFRLKACAKCGGDLALDQGDWICLQCGTYYYVGLYRHNVGQLHRRPRCPLPGEKSAFGRIREVMPGPVVIAASLLTIPWAGDIVTK